MTSWAAHSRLLFAAGLCALLLLLGAWHGLRAVFRHRHSLTLWLGALLGAVLASYWLSLARLATYRHVDEVTDLHATIVAAFSGLDPVDRAYPAFYPIISGCLHALLIVARAALGGLSLERAAAIALLTETDILLLSARLVSALSCLGILALVHRMTTTLTGTRLPGLLPVLFLLTSDHFAPWPFWVSPHPLALFLGLSFIHLTAVRSPTTPLTPARAAGLGVLFGVGLATHYFTIVLAPVFVLAASQRRAKLRPGRALTVFVATLSATFTLINYRLFVRPHDYAYSLSRHVSQLLGDSRMLPSAVALLAALLGAAALFVLGGRLLRSSAPKWLPQAALALPAAIYLIVFNTATLVLPWYHVYPAALLAILAATLLVKLFSSRPALRIIGRVGFVILLILLGQRFPAALQSPSEEICFDRPSRGRTLIDSLREHEDIPGPIGVYDNSMFAFEQWASFDPAGGWLIAAVQREIQERTGRETVWLSRSAAPREHSDKEISLIFRLAWDSGHDDFDHERLVGFELVDERAGGDCKLTIHRRRGLGEAAR